MTDLFRIAAETLPLWRDTAVALLALVVLACLWYVAEAG